MSNPVAQHLQDRRKALMDRLATKSLMREYLTAEVQQTVHQIATIDRELQTLAKEATHGRPEADADQPR